MAVTSWLIDKSAYARLGELIAATAEKSKLTVLAVDKELRA